MRLFRILVAVGLIVGSAATATPVAAGDPCYHGFEQPSRSESTDPQVKLMPCAFAPTVVRVAPGTTVQFFSGPDFVHLITGAGQEWGSRDDEIQPESTVAYRFDRPGTYPYACALHRGMSGTIVVGDGIDKPAASGDGPAVVTIVAPKAAASAPAAAASDRSRSASAGASSPSTATVASAASQIASRGSLPLPAIILAVLAVAIAALGAARAIARRGRGPALEH